MSPDIVSLLVVGPMRTLTAAVRGRRVGRAVAVLLLGIGALVYRRRRSLLDEADAAARCVTAAPTFVTDTGPMHARCSCTRMNVDQQHTPSTQPRTADAKGAPLLQPANLHAASAVECCRRCTEHTACRVFTFVAGGGQCWSVPFGVDRLDPRCVPDMIARAPG